MSLLEQLPRPVIFAHRGASAFAPENTLAAFRLASELGAPAIELDVKLNADGQVVVIHDQTVDRTTNGHGDVRNSSLAALRDLDAGRYFDPQYAGEKIPLLSEVLETVGHQMLVNIELTNYATTRDQLVEKVAELVKQHAMTDRVLFSSFTPFNLLRMHRLLPDTPSGLLALEGRSGIIARSFMGRWITPKIIHPFRDDVTPVFVARQKRVNRRIHVWTVNDPLEMKRLFDLGVDGIFTDNPRLALDTIKNK
jgi:glycerophosphoryl diester phosphodiesterase